MGQDDAQGRTRDELLKEIGRNILSDVSYRDGGWRAVSLIYTFQPGVQSTDGFVYPDDPEGRPYPELPEDKKYEISDTVEELREVMSRETGSAWQQMLYQIWMPGPDVAATFEYDRPDRWSLRGYSVDGVSSFAEQVDPARGRAGG